MEEKLHFHTFGVTQNKNNEKKNDEEICQICQMLVSGALEWTKKIRKTAADMFAKSGPEKPRIFLAGGPKRKTILS